MTAAGPHLVLCWLILPFAGTQVLKGRGCGLDTAWKVIGNGRDIDVSDTCVFFRKNRKLFKKLREEKLRITPGIGRPQAYI